MNSYLHFRLGAHELQFLFDLLLAMACGMAIGLERELKRKPAGVSTQTLVVGGSMIFAFLSHDIGAGDPTRIAAQIVTGIGFLGAGIILRSKSSGRVVNVTTAASIWFSAGIGMAIGFNLHLIAIMATIYSVVISRIPRVRR